VRHAREGLQVGGVGRGEQVDVDAPGGVGDPPAPVVARPCGTATVPGAISSVTVTGSSTEPCGEEMRHRSPSWSPCSAASSGAGERMVGIRAQSEQLAVADGGGQPAQRLADPPV